MKLIDQQNELRPYYLPDFKPKSTTSYDNFDVKIYDCFIRTIDGNKVNVLVQNQEYIYIFKVSFGIDAMNVRFGTSFKTEKGLIISGAKYPYDDSYIEKVNKGQKYKIKIRFKCTFLPATYYLTTGVNGFINGKRVFLNRIEDIIVFKVQKDKRDKYWGLVNLNQQLSVIDIT